MQVFVVLTVQRTNEQFTVAQTVNVAPSATRSGLLQRAIGQAPERYRGGKGTVLFFSADPDQLAPGQAIAGQVTTSAAADGELQSRSGGGDAR
jgi:hypothetical protein